MTRKNFYWVYACLAVIVLIGIAYWSWPSARHAPPRQPEASAPVVQQSETPVPPQSTTYENEYMRIRVPDGWTLTEATTVLQDQIYDKNTGTTTKVGKPHAIKTGAVNIAKGSYILYINPNAGQASGVEGGRFGEIAGGAPSSDAVITDHPAPPCVPAQEHDLDNGWQRDDLYIASTDKVGWCKVPTNGKTVWYLSYITTPAGGYFNYYRNGQASAWVITMAYNSSVVNNLPQKGSAELEAALSEMTAIAATTVFKRLQ